MLKLNQISSGYGESQIIRGLDLEVKTGEIVSIMGNNGVGKSTLLKTIMGILPGTKGRIWFDNEEMTHSTPDQRAVRGIGYVPQGRDIFPFLTVKENLMIGMEARDDKSGRVPEDIFELFPAIKDLLHRKGGDLSGGQQQQLAIARILVTNPKILILDEPTEGIQPSIVFQIENAIRFIKEQKSISVLLVEQYFDFAVRLSDKFHVMEKGSFTYQSSADETSRVEVKKYLSI